MKTKKKLLVAVCMLLVSAVMLTTASYAWFTISTAPEIANFSANAAANGNLEIALDSTGTEPAASAEGDSGINEKWGNLINLNGNTALTNLVLKPVEVDTSGNVKIPSFGADGRLISATTVTATGTGVKTYVSGDSTWAIAIDFWMRSNVGGDVTLLATGADRGAGEAGGGSYVKVNNKENDMVKVAFVSDGDVNLAAENSSLPSEVVSLTANQAKKVTAIIYMDGAGMTNADFETGEDPTVEVNLQFTLGELNGIDITGTGNGRETTPTATPST